MEASLDKGDLIFLLAGIDACCAFFMLKDLMVNCNSLILVVGFDWMEITFWHVVSFTSKG